MQKIKQPESKEPSKPNQTPPTSPATISLTNLDPGSTNTQKPPHSSITSPVQRTPSSPMTIPGSSPKLRTPMRSPRSPTLANEDDDLADTRGLSGRFSPLLANYVPKKRIVKRRENKEESEASLPIQSSSALPAQPTPTPLTTLSGFWDGGAIFFEKLAADSKTTAVEVVFGLTPLQARDALLLYSDDPATPSEKHKTIRKFVANEIRHAFYRSCEAALLPESQRDSYPGTLPEVMKFAAEKEIQSYVAVQKEWQETLSSINEELRARGDIKAPELTASELFAYFQSQARQHKDEPPAYLNDPLYCQLRDAQEDYLRTEAECAGFNEESHKVRQAWLETLSEINRALKRWGVIEEDKEQSGSYSAGKLLQYFQTEEANANAGEVKTDQAIEREAFHQKFLTVNKAYIESTNAITQVLQERLAPATQAWKQNLREINKAFVARGANKPIDLTADQLLIHFQRLYFQQQISSDASSDKDAEAGYLKKGTPDKDNLYRKLIEGKRKIIRAEVLLDAYCEQRSTYVMYLNQQLAKTGELRVLQRKKRVLAKVEVVEGSLGDKRDEGTKESLPEVMSWPLPSVVDALAEHTATPIALWEIEEAHPTTLQPVHWYRPLQPGKQLLHCLRSKEGTHYRLQSNASPEVKEATTAESTPLKLSKEGYRLDVDRDALLHWQDRYFWEAVIAINTIIQDGDAIRWLEILLGPPIFAVRSRHERELEPLHLEKTYQDTMVNLFGTIQDTLRIYGDHRYQEEVFATYLKRLPELHAQHVAGKEELLATSQADLARLTDPFFVAPSEVHKAIEAIEGYQKQIKALQEKLEEASFGDFIPLFSQIESLKQKCNKVLKEKLSGQEINYPEILDLQQTIKDTEEWLIRYHNQIDWVEKERREVAQAQRKYQELWQVYEGKQEGVAKEVRPDDNVGVNGYLYRLGETSKTTQDYYRTARKNYERYGQLLNLPLPSRKDLSPQERDQVVQQLIQQMQLFVTIGFSSVKSQYTLRFQQLHSYFPLSHSMREENTITSFAEQYHARIQKVVQDFLGDPFISSFKATGDLVALENGVASIQKIEDARLTKIQLRKHDLDQKYMTEQKDLRNAFQDANKGQDGDKEGKEVMGTLTWLNKNRKYLPPYYQNENPHFKKKLLEDIVDTAMGETSLAQAVLEDTGDTLVHFALLPFNKVEGKEKERLCEAIRILFQRGGDGNVKNRHEEPQTAYRFARFRLVSPEDWKHVINEFTLNRSLSELEEKARLAILRYCEESYRRYTSAKAALSRLVSKEEERWQQARLYDIQLTLEIWHQSRHKLDDSQLVKILTLLKDDEEVQDRGKPAELGLQKELGKIVRKHEARELFYLGPTPTQIQLADEKQKVQDSQDQAKEDRQKRIEADKRAAEDARKRKEAEEQAAEDARKRKKAEKQATEDARKRQEAEERAAKIDAALRRLGLTSEQLLSGERLSIPNQAQTVPVLPTATPIESEEKQHHASTQNSQDIAAVGLLPAKQGENLQVHGFSAEANRGKIVETVKGNEEKSKSQPALSAIATTAGVK